MERQGPFSSQQNSTPFSEPCYGNRLSVAFLKDVLLISLLKRVYQVPIECAGYCARQSCSNSGLPVSQTAGDRGVLSLGRGECEEDVASYAGHTQVPANLYFMTDTSAQGRIHSSHR